ncbi:hypothetical protein BGX34_006442, partial [Mortierella sp. NVP85]
MAVVLRLMKADHTAEKEGQVTILNATAAGSVARRKAIAQAVQQAQSSSSSSSKADREDDGKERGLFAVM